MTEVQLFLSDAQLKKVDKGLVFQSTITQLKQEPNVQIKLPVKDAKRLAKNMRDGKGFRFKPDTIDVMDEIEGGKIKWKKIGRLAKRTASRVAKNVGNSFADDFQKETGLNVRDKRQVRGKVIRKAKDVGKEIATETISQTASAIGSLAGAKLGGPAGAALGSHLATEAVKPLNRKLEKAIDGAGATKKQKFVKGSQEAKDFMARLRASRKSGGSVAKPTPMPSAPKIVTGDGACKCPVLKSGAGIVQPLGGGSYTRINLINPDIIANKSKGAKVRGGSFKVAGGSFLP